MSNSSLICYTNLSPNKTAPRNKPITKQTVHHTAGVLSIESLGGWFGKSTTQASCTYGIGNDGRKAMFVEEKNRPWTSSSPANDHQAVTYEVVNSSTGGEWPISKAAYAALIDMMVDVCKRNPGIKQKNGQSGLYYDGTPNGSLTFHEMFTSTNCPGPYIKKYAQQICTDVNSRLANGSTPTPPVTTAVSYQVKVTTGSLNIRSGPSTNDSIVRAITDYGTYNIVAEASGTGASKWGQLEIGGWISLDYTEKISQPEVVTPLEQKGDLTMDQYNELLGIINSQGKQITGLQQEIANITSTAATGDEPSDWAKAATEYCKKNGIFNGDGEGNYGWKQSITREAAAQLIYNILNKK